MRALRRPTSGYPDQTEPDAARVPLARRQCHLPDDRQPADGFEAEFQRLKTRIHRELIDSLDLSRIAALDQAHLRAHIQSLTEGLLRARSEMLSRIDEERLVDELLAAGVWAVMAESDQTWQILFAGGATAAALSIVLRLYVFFRRRQRRQEIRQGLPEVIDMLGMCSSGGLGLSESLQHVAGQISTCPQLAEELLILKRQAELGSLKQALADLSTRVDLPEMRQLVGLLTRGTQLGTQLAGSLSEQANHLRLSRRQSAMAQANKMPVKLVLPILFCFAPAALTLLTAPAVLELHDFLRPSQEKTAAGEGFGTGAIFDSLDSLDQRVDPAQNGRIEAP